ncbi:uncharacterized protein LOC143362344 [Halictus rubicundus]|uniref:uncharacterized protein LOC143362344 n=1 Tax=Halictus rubicundus TaxID=77578 RepID=UPI004036AD67
MANTSALPRNSVRPRSPNDFDGIIERIESLQLSCEIGKKIGTADRGEPTDRKKKWNIALDNDRGNRDVDDNGNKKEQDEEADRTDRLIARGPMKPHYLPRSRDAPYDCAYNVQQPARTNETYLLDYEQIAVQILGDKEFCERVYSCLDQLPTNDKSLVRFNDEIEKSSGIQGASVGFGVDSAYDENDDDALLEKLLRGDLQAAEYCSNIDSPATTTSVETTPRHDSPVISSSENRDSSYAPYVECPWMQNESNNLHSPFGSPVIVPDTTSHRAPQHSRDAQNCCSLSPCSSSSSYSPSSSQSYGEACSPNDFRMVNGVLGSGIEETLSEELYNCPFWSDGFKPLEENRNPPDTVKSVENESNCDKTDLQLIEEVLWGMADGNQKEPEEQRSPQLSIRPEKIADVPPNANPISIPYRIDSDAPRLFYETAQKCNPVYRIPDIDDSIPSTDYQLDAIVPNYATETNESALSNATNGYHGASTVPIFSTFTESFVTNSSAVHPVANAVNNANNVNNVNNVNNASSVNGIEARLLFPEHHQRSQSAGEFQTPKFTNNRDDLQIPETVACFERTASSRIRRNSERNIVPWPLLDLPSVKASERLKEAVDPKEVERAMRCLLKWSPEEIAKQDKDGYTALMCLVGNPEELAKKIAYLAPLVERTPRDVLSYSNNRDEDALYLAALNCPQFSYVTGYLAAMMLQKGIDVSQRLYNTRGNTLVHLVAGQGDTHAKVMAELLALKSSQGNGVFDLSKRNYDGKTALHVAIESHEPSTRRVSSVATVKLLLECGADPKVIERKCGDSALHMAVSLTADPALVKVLLEKHGAVLVNRVNYNLDTPLHAAATVSNNVPLERQSELFRLLIQAGGQTNLLNRQGKVPLALVAAERKSVIKKVIYKRS